MHDKTKVGRVDKSEHVESVSLEQTLSTNEIRKLIQHRRNIISGRIWGVIVLWCMPLVIAFFWSLQAGHLIIFALAIAIPVAITVAGIFIILMLITNYFTYKDELKQIGRIQAANQALWQQISLEPRKSLLKTHIRPFIKDYLKAIITILVIITACVIYFVRESHISITSVPSERMQKLAQSFQTQYGESFQVTKEAYNPESNGYSYTVIPQSMPDKKLVVITNFLGKGLFISNYLQTHSVREAVDLVQSFFEGLLDIYRVRASDDVLSTLELSEDQAYIAKHIKLIPTHSVKADIFGDTIDSWAISRRYSSEQAQFLVNTPLYQQIVKLQSREKTYE